MAEKKIGEVMKFFETFSGRGKDNGRWNIRRRQHEIFRSHYWFTDVIESMEVDNKSVQKAVAGDFIGVKVSDRVRPAMKYLR